MDSPDAGSLFAAIEAGDLHRVREIVAQAPALAGARNADGLSAVLAARYRNAMEMVDVLLATDPALDLYDASALGATERVVQSLDEDPGPLNHLSGDGMTALHLAVFFGHSDTALLLLERGAALHARAVPFGTPMPLHSAIAGNHVEPARLLLRYGADVNAEQTKGWRPLHSAAQHGNLEMVRLLLASGADPTLVTDGGRRPADVVAGPDADAIRALLGEASPIG